MDRLHALDAQFLHLEDDCSPMHIAGLCIFEGPPPERDEAVRFVSSRLPLLPRYRRRVRSVPLELGRPVWIDDARFDLDDHVHRTALPAPGDDAALCALMGRLMSTPLDRRRPLWELWIVTGLMGGRWAIISKVHHAMVDGIAGVALMATLLAEGRDTAPAAALPFRPAPEPSPAALILDAWKGLAEDAGALAGRLARALRDPAAAARAGAGLAAGLAVFLGRLATLRSGAIQGRVGNRRSYAHAQVALADVQAIRKALGGTVNDVILAALAGGYRDLLAHRGEDPDRAHLRSLVPVSLRAAGEEGGQDNHVSALLCDLPVDVADPVRRLHAVTAQMGRLKASHMAEAGAWVLELAALAPPMLVGPLTRLAARVMHGVPQRALGTITTNVPGPRQPLFFLGRRMTDWFPYVPISQGARVGTAILSYAGKIAFGITADRDSVRDAAILTRGVERAVAELTARAELSGHGPAGCRRAPA